MTDPDAELLPYSMRRSRRVADKRLPQEMDADEQLNDVVDAAARGSSQPVVNLGFARLKGHRR